MPGLADFRAQFPQYNNRSDQELADALYSQYYADRMPRAEFDTMLGVQPQSGPPLRSNAPPPDAPPMLPSGPPQEVQLSSFDIMSSQAPPPSTEPGRSFWRGLGDFGHSALNGLTFGNADTIGGVIGGIRSTLQGEGWDAGYQPNVMGERARLEEARQHNPVGSTIAEIGGSIPTLAAPGAWAFRAPSLLTKVGRSAAVGAGGGAAAGAGNADDGNRLLGAANGALWGGALGAAAPPVGAAIGAGIRSARNINPFNGATNVLNTAMRNSGETAQDIAAAMGANPRLMPANVSPTMENLLMGTVVQPGGARNVAAEALNVQRAGAPSAMRAAFDDSLGITPDVRELLEGMKATARSNADAGFGNALANAKPVNVDPVIEFINSQIAPGIRGLPGMATRTPTPVENELLRVLAQITNDGRGMITDPYRLHAIQSEIRRYAQTLASSSDGGQRQLSGILFEVRRVLDDAIDEAAGGTYRPALQQYSDDMDIERAFTRGLEVFQNPTGPAGARNLPDFWRAEVADMSAAELDALRNGVRVAAEIKMSSATNAARAGQAITDTDFNLERLRIILGDEEADMIAQVMRDETAIARTGNNVLGNSATAQRQQAAALVPVRSMRPNVADGVFGSAGGTFAGFQAAEGQYLPAAVLAALAAARAGGRKLGQRYDMARNEELTRLLTQSGPAGQQSILRAAAPQPAVPQGMADLLRLITAPAVTQQPFQLLPSPVAP